MNKIIGIDIDDCICNTLEMDKACGIYYAQKNNIKLPLDAWKTTNYYIPNEFNFTKFQEIDFFTKEKQFIMKNTAMYPKVFVKEVIEQLKKKGFKIIFITSRDNIFWNGNAYKFAKKWLKKYGIKYDKIYASVNDKASLCQKLNLDFMIEDNPEFAKKVNDNNLRTFLIKTQYNKNYSNEKNIFAENWLDLYIKLGGIYNFNTDNIIFN